MDLLLIITLYIVFSLSRQVIGTEMKVDCYREVCIRKCCQMGYALIQGNCTLTDVPFEISVNYPYRFVHGFECPYWQAPVMPFPEKYFELKASGDLLLTLSNETSITKEYFEYCIDHIDNSTYISVIICANKEEETLIHDGKIYAIYSKLYVCKTLF